MAKRLNIWQNVSDEIGSVDANFRNRLINGDFLIDQRNAGASLTNTVANSWPVDRWRIYGDVAGKFSAQQNYNISPPPGFISHIGILSLSAYSVGASEVFQLTQAIEGYNVADLAWGTSSATAVTLSFWVQSSISGTFGGAVQNSATNRSYPFLFNIISANAWEYKKITIPGDTTGTWLKDNSAGVVIRFCFGSGSTHSGVSGVWASADYRTANTATSLVGTNGATFYLTGVQFEKGGSATPFETLPFSVRISLCQRYFEKSYAIGTVPGTAGGNGAIIGSRQNGGFECATIFRVMKNTTPTMTIYSPATGTSAKIRNNATAADETVSNVSANDNGVNVDGTTVTFGERLHYHYTAEAEL